MSGRDTHNEGPRKGSNPSSSPGESEDGARRRILEAAVVEFAAQGFQGGTTSAVARRAGVTQPLVHYYYGSKDGLWRASVEWGARMLGGVLSAVEEDIDGKAPEDALRIFVRRIVYFVAAHPEFVRIRLREGHEDNERVRWLVDTHLAETFRIMTSLVRGLAPDLPGDVAANMVVSLLGSIEVAYAAPALVTGLLGADPRSDAALTGYADTVANTYLSALRNA
jgi:TetR/AcrR family transcriptional regulator